MLINKNKELIVVMASFTLFEIVIEVDAKLLLKKKKILMLNLCMMDHP